MSLTALYDHSAEGWEVQLELLDSAQTLWFTRRTQFKNDHKLLKLIIKRQPIICVYADVAYSVISEQEVEHRYKVVAGFLSKSLNQGARYWLASHLNNQSALAINLIGSSQGPLPGIGYSQRRGLHWLVAQPVEVTIGWIGGWQIVCRNGEEGLPV